MEFTAICAPRSGAIAEQGVRVGSSPLTHASSGAESDLTVAMGSATSAAPLQPRGGNGIGGHEELHELPECGGESTFPLEVGLVRQGLAEHPTMRIETR